MGEKYLDNATPTHNGDSASEVAAGALLSGIAVVVFNALPALVGAAAEHFSLDFQQMGVMVSAYFSGHTLLCVLALFWIERFRWRKLAWLTAVSAALGFTFLAFVSSYQLMLTVLFLIGCCGGTMFVLAMTSIADSRLPSRNFGYAFLSQLTIGVLVLYAFKGDAAQSYGFVGLVLGLAVLFLLSTVIICWFPKKRRLHDAVTGKGFRIRPFTVLLAVVLFFAGGSTVWSFFERLGDGQGFSAEFIGNVLIASLLAGAVASLVTIALANKIGVRAPVIIGVCCLVGSYYYLVPTWFDESAYLRAALIFQFGIQLTSNYMSACLAELDTTGRHGPLLPGAFGVGLIAGPWLGGTLMMFSTSQMLIMSAVTPGIGLVLFLIATRRIVLRTG
jgi:DHA1 family inner membrane transport protein